MVCEGVHYGDNSKTHHISRESISGVAKGANPTEGCAVAERVDISSAI